MPRERARGRWPTVAVVGLGQFLVVLSTSVVGVALPTIGGDLDASATQLQWVVDAYVLVFASLLVPAGVLGDRHGRRRAFLAGVAVFGAGSLFTGIAPSIGWLLAGRLVQGVGPALVQPASLAIIRVAFEDPRRRAAAIGLWSASSGLALAVGPAVGGGIAEAAGWRWVFLLNVPLCAALGALAVRWVPTVERAPVTRRFDWLGAVLTTGGLGALAFGLIEGQDRGWGAPVIVGAFVAATASLAGLVAWELRRPEPLVDVRLFARAPFAAANVAALLVFFAFIGAIVYFSAFFQVVQGRTPAQAGLCVLPFGVAFALAAPVAGRLVGRFGPRAPATAGLVVCAAAMLALTRLEGGSRPGAVWWALALVGGGAGLCLTPLTATAVAAGGTARAGMASAIHNAMRQIGQVLGVAVLGALVLGGLPAGAASGGRLDAAEAAVFVDGLHAAVRVSGIALLAAAVLTAITFPRAPDGVRALAGPGTPDPMDEQRRDDDETEEVVDRGGIGAEGGDDENADTLPPASGEGDDTPLGDTDQHSEVPPPPRTGR
jgi:EmrB/QacA subfamily drug resistance transporter